MGELLKLLFQFIGFITFDIDPIVDDIDPIVD